MTMKFEAEWIQGHTPGEDPVEATRCLLALAIDGRAMFRHEDLLNEHQVRDRIHVAAHPLAFWLAANWWRLLCEPPWPNSGTPRHDPEYNDWLMSHQLGAAAGGYYWPDLVLASDGDAFICQQRPTKEEQVPLRYLGDHECWIPVSHFTEGVSAFIEATIDHLEGMQCKDERLAACWAQVTEERADPAIAATRQMEARLGYDPGEAPEKLLEQLLKLSGQAGRTATEELAAAGRKQVTKTAADVGELLRQTVNRMRVPKLSADEQRLHDTGIPPWSRGYEAAASARHSWGLGQGALSDKVLAECLDTTPDVLGGSDEENTAIAAGQRNDGDSIGFFLGKRRPESRRFRLARIVADNLYAGAGDRWLPCTGALTSRQKFQRAFAQEFLCPWEGLLDYMQTEHPDEELCSSAAEHFQVSELMISHILDNHGLAQRREYV